MTITARLRCGGLPTAYEVCVPHSVWPKVGISQHPTSFHLVMAPWRGSSGATNAGGAGLLLGPEGFVLLAIRTLQSV